MYCATVARTIDGCIFKPVKLLGPPNIVIANQIGTLKPPNTYPVSNNSDQLNLGNFVNSQYRITLDNQLQIRYQIKVESAHCTIVRLMNPSFYIIPSKHQRLS